jgi:hypothetical protein
VVSEEILSIGLVSCGMLCYIGFLEFDTGRVNFLGSIQFRKWPSFVKEAMASNQYLQDRTCRSSMLPLSQSRAARCRLESCLVACLLHVRNF